ncbi:MAG TPA: acetyl-CoA carboxylase biotin carboxyl carrier protein [Rubricoccaceae bacterium]|nr:acetyl-CoA carboxylase biotin carboxyl carrier protein [Rubricoccaceae bacterium]
MDLDRIERLIGIVASSGMAEVEVEEGDFRLLVRAVLPASAAPAPQMMTFAPPSMAAPAAPGAPAAPAVPAAPAEAPATPAAPSADEHVVQAPIVGTFYRAASPDSPPFVEVGQVVKPGDVLCIIEAMKLMNEIKADVGGTVRRILVENATPVEYDQPLFAIEKS